MPWQSDCKQEPHNASIGFPCLLCSLGPRKTLVLGAMACRNTLRPHLHPPKKQDLEIQKHKKHGSSSRVSALFGQTVFLDIAQNLLAAGPGRDALPQDQQVRVADLLADEGVGQVARGADAVPMHLVESPRRGRTSRRSTRKSPYRRRHTSCRRSCRPASFRRKGSSPRSAAATDSSRGNSEHP